MSAVRINQLPLSLPGARYLMAKREGQAGAIQHLLNRRIAGHGRYDEQENHQNECCDQQRQSGHCSIALMCLTLC